MKRSFLLAVMVAVAVGFPGRASAETFRIPLKDFLAVDVITLQGASDNTEDREFSIPLSERWQIRSAVMRFDYTCSSALLREASMLTVLVNEYPVGQIQLEPKSPSGHAVVTIPPERIKAGYNPLLFIVTQHVTRDECEDPTLPELWTKVDLTNAELELDVTPKPVPEKLSAIGGFLFNPCDLISTQVHITVPEMSPDYLSRAALAAAGAALRFEYRPVTFTVSDQIAPLRDNLVIGPPSFLETLRLKGFEPGSGATLAVTHLPLPKTDDPDQTVIDPYHAVVIMTGSSNEDLDRAAKAFSLFSTPFPPLPVTPVQNVTEPPLGPYSIKSGIEGGQAYTFASMGFSPTSAVSNEIEENAVILRGGGLVGH